MTAPQQLATCLVCGSSRHTRGHLGDVTERCEDCTFTWTSGASVAPEDLYDEAYYSGGGYEDYFQPAARRFEANLRLDWLRTVHTPKSLVEAGCAAGFFVEAAMLAGIEAQGVEVAETVVRYAVEELGVPVRQGRFEDMRFDERFDAVCAFHVLEHVDDPVRFVAAAWSAVQPGGVFAVEVPNIDSMAAVRQGPQWPGLQLEFHRWHFTPQSLVKLLSARGFDVITQDTIVFRYYMPPRFRRRQGRHLIKQDVRALHSLRLVHPRRADLLRVIARKPDDGNRP